MITDLEYNSRYRGGTGFRPVFYIWKNGELCRTDGREVVGIPYGKQCFKFASLSFFPFGKDVEYGGGTFSTIVNIIWLIFFGIWMALENLIIGALWCITIVGIPFGKQFFKIAKLSLMPFGARIV